MTHFFKRAALAGAVAAVAFFAATGPAAAESPAPAAMTQTTFEVRVDGDAIAAGDAQAVRDAHNAIVRAARRACGHISARMTLSERRAARECAAAAVEATILAESRPALSAYFAALDDDRRFAINRGRVPDTLLAAIEGAVRS